MWFDHLCVDFRLSNDERIRSYMTVNDWKDELYEANEQQWCVDRRKFNNEQIIREYDHNRKNLFQ